VSTLWWRSFAALGTECGLYLFADNRRQADRVAERALAEIRRIEAKYSRYRPDSVLSTINAVAARGGTVAVDEETAGLLDYAFACHARSDGLFDITSGVLRRVWNFSGKRPPAAAAVDALLPLVGRDRLSWRRPSLSFATPGMEIDFGGIGKEYAADRLADLCAAAGVERGLVDLGGDIRLIGTAPADAPWPIRIRAPNHAATAIATVPLAAGALATSGSYERYIDADGRRYSHLLDPRTGWPVQGLSSVTVAAPYCMVAGSLATIAMLKGRDGIAWLHALAVPHLWIDDTGRCGGNLADPASHGPASL
jgi:thiamine biosynthesis lipoprotein